MCYERGSQSYQLPVKFDHATPLLIELHWLPVRQRIVVKILLYTFKALHGVTPIYLTELISPYALRSADQLLLEQPTHKLKSIGLRAFSVCVPYLWNSLPFEIKSSASVPILKAKFKTYLFHQAYFFRLLTFFVLRFLLLLYL